MSLATVSANTAPTSTLPRTAWLRSREEELDWEVLRSSDRDAALHVWAEVERSIRDGGTAAVPPPVVASRLWTEAWLDSYGDAVPHEFLLVRNERGPIGVTLLTRGVGRRIGPFPIRTRHVGTAGEDPREGACVEYNDLLALPQYKSLFQEQLLTYVLRDKSWGTLCLDGFSEAGLKGILQDLPGFEVRFRESPYYDLSATRAKGCDLLDPLGRSTRQNLRRVLRKYGEIDCEWAETAAQADDIFAELVELHQARWRAAGEAGAFHSPRFHGFQKRLVNAAYAGPANERPVVLYRARHAGETIGCLMLLADGGRLLDYLSGFADFNVKASPGLVTHSQCMEAALRRGFDAYDFLVGEKRHKANLSTNVNQLAWATWTRTTVASRTIALIRKLKQRWSAFRAGEATGGRAESPE